MAVIGCTIRRADISPNQSRCSVGECTACSIVQHSSSKLRPFCTLLQQHYSFEAFRNQWLSLDNPFYVFSFRPIRFIAARVRAQTCSITEHSFSKLRSLCTCLQQHYSFEAFRNQWLSLDNPFYVFSFRPIRFIAARVRAQTCSITEHSFSKLRSLCTCLQQHYSFEAFRNQWL
ncbi:uncharacterized protein LOC143305823 [Osmia lignaria lignaria]|uniref:uncharacterized protein LOC143305823 n=1 Tax=Osmia lignaria lignaria TaxID=1437193 RepID=UPI00402B5618